MTTTLDVTNRATWPEVLTLDEVALILRRAAGGIAKACQQRTFVPAPAFNHPRRWRKADVIRHLDRGSMQLRRPA